MRQRELAGCIQDLGGIFEWQIGANRGDLSIGNGDIGLVSIGRSHHRTISNDRVEAHANLTQMNGVEEELCYTAAL
jgi:hypothetical protein